jgi:protein O-GlcNAc transferase
MTQVATQQARKLQEARELFARGKFTEAGRICEALVAADPKIGVAWFLLGCIYQRLGHLDDAIDTIQNAIGLSPFEGGFHAQAGEIFQDAGKPVEAEAHYRHALMLNPNMHQAYNGLGILLVDLKRWEEAIGAFRRAVEIRPDYAIALNNLGNALMAQGRMDEASRCFERAIEAKPDYAGAQKMLAALKVRKGDAVAAFDLLQRVVTAHADDHEAHFALAGIYRERGATREALAQYRDATRLKPAEPNYLNALADFLWQQGDFDSATALYRHTLTVAPASLRAHLCANLLLPVMVRGADELEASRKHFEAGLQHLERGIPDLLDNRPGDLERDVQWDNFYLAYQGRHDRALQVRYATLTKKILHRIAPEQFELQPRLRPSSGRVRVGFASHNFYNCTAGHYFRSWITDLDAERFEVFVYHLNPQVDDLTEAIRAPAASFKRLSSHSLLEVAREIAQDELDVLIFPEIGMHPAVFCLASLRLAPVQCAGWGHPVTTGHDNVDYFLSCGDMEPAGADGHYSEKLVRLPGLGTSYQMTTTDSQVTRGDLQLPADKFLYLVPQSLFKIHPDNDALIADVLQAEPNAIVVVFEPERQDVVKRIFAERMERQFEQRGIDPAGRICMLPRMTRRDYLRVNQLCDVMLDTLHWSGGNTSLDAIASGLPIVTLPGQFMRGRQSFAMLKAMGCDELIARDSADYVSIALRIGRDAGLRNEISARILARRDVLFSRNEPIRALESFLLDAVRAS